MAMTAAATATGSANTAVNSDPGKKLVEGGEVGGRLATWGGGVGVGGG